MHDLMPPDLLKKYRVQRPAQRYVELSHLYELADRQEAIRLACPWPGSTVLLYAGEVLLGPYHNDAALCQATHAVIQDEPSGTIQ